ncbi:MAG: serine/threonine protein kinase [Polyangiaceae bacterium]|nr:serine/threonine protein kinase [Polyangiaceae bacterium]
MKADDGASPTLPAEPLAPLEAPAPPASSVRGAPHPLVGRLLAERFQVVELLGQGGMGAVFRAEHVHMKKPVALKVLHRVMTYLPEVVARFEREAVAAGRIDHPHVATALDFGRLEDGSFYLVLEYVDGRSLGSLLKQGPLPQTRAVQVAAQVAEALAAAHAAGIVHRDLKPENVMLIERAGEGDFVKVLDFGIAKVAAAEGSSGEAITRAGTVFGTPEYMAPEQASGREVDARADLYALGAIVYDMLAGRPPFHAEDVAETLRLQIAGALPPFPGGIDPELEALARALLEKDAARRPQSAAEVAAQLRTLHDRMARNDPGSVSVPEALTSRSDAASQPSLDWRSSGPGTLPGAPGGARAPSHAQIDPAASGGALGPLAPLEPLLARLRAIPPRTLAGIAIPLWVGAMVVLAAVAVPMAVLLIWVGRRAPAPAAASAREAPAAEEVRSAARPPEAPLDPEHAALLTRAARGEKAALESLEGVAPERRTVSDWTALARGKMESGDVAGALEADRRALELDATLAGDTTLLRHVRKAAGTPETAEAALRLAAQRLGARGADLLYDVWVGTKRITPTTQLAKDLVYSDEVRRAASPALAIALDLRAAESCAEVARLLPRATLHGDARAIRVLLPMQKATGCGPDEKEDCWPCLRADETLKTAIAEARQRPEPVF